VFRDKLYDKLFDTLLPLWSVMFPSSRILTAFPPDSMEVIQVSLVTDGFDQPVWRFLAGFALEGTVEQHSRLVTQLRAKVMGTLKMAQRLEEGKAKARKIRNVDLFLNALGLSSSQIPVQ
jgi:DNA topoisomerase 2-associated protein PAT1